MRSTGAPTSAVTPSMSLAVVVFYCPECAEREFAE
jgi:hypothetical protein